MKQVGVVVSAEEDKAKVLLTRQSACGECKGCKLGSDDMEMEVEAFNSIDAKIGDRVEVDMENQNVLAAAFIAYTIPLIALFLGVFVGNMILGRAGMTKYKDIGSGIFGILLTIITYIIIRTKEKTLRSDKRFVPTITGISR